MCQQALDRLVPWTAGSFVVTMERAGYRGCFRRIVAMEDGIPRKRWKVLAMWHADHVVAVADGGGGTGRENAVAKCIPCHRARTAAQAKSRAAVARKNEHREFKERIVAQQRKKLNR